MVFLLIQNKRIMLKFLGLLLSETLISEKEMFDLILEVAKKDERIRAAYMNGSRTNPNVPKDIFQDYDIVFGVTEIIPFIN